MKLNIIDENSIEIFIDEYTSFIVRAGEDALIVEPIKPNLLESVGTFDYLYIRTKND